MSQFKHRNSMTNSISSFQLILWFRIVIPTEKAVICKSFVCYVHIMFVYVLTAYGCTISNLSLNSHGFSRKICHLKLDPKDLFNIWSSVSTCLLFLKKDLELSISRFCLPTPLHMTEQDLYYSSNAFKMYMLALLTKIIFIQYRIISHKYIFSQGHFRKDFTSHRSVILCSKLRLR